MKTPLRFLLTALGLALAASAAVGQTTWKTHCTNVGPASSEPLGDRDGHGLSVANSVCTVEGGPFNGGVTTQQVIWEGDQAKGASTLLSGDGVTRKPGATSAYRNVTGTLTYVMKDGKPAGWTASGTSVITLAVGEAASWKGKTVSWTGKATGPRTFVIESKLE